MLKAYGWEVVVSKDIDDSMCLSNHMSHNILKYWVLMRGARGLGGRDHKRIKMMVCLTFVLNCAIVGSCNDVT